MLGILSSDVAQGWPDRQQRDVLETVGDERARALPGHAREPLECRAGTLAAGILANDLRLDQ